MEWRSEKTKTFPEFVPLDPLPERATICPTCGRELAEDVKKKILDDYEASVELHQNKYSEDKAKFEEARAKKLEQIEKDGKEAAASRDKLKTNETELHKKMDELNIQLADAQKKYDIAKAELGKFPTKADIYFPFWSVIISTGRPSRGGRSTLGAFRLFIFVCLALPCDSARCVRLSCANHV